MYKTTSMTEYIRTREDSKVYTAVGVEEFGDGRNFHEFSISLLLFGFFKLSAILKFH